MALRITGGEARGRTVQAPKGEGTRPTAERVREALFDVLHSMRGALDGLELLDLYAGSGALGLEALSRGASRAVFVERDRACQRLIRANAERLGWTDRCRVLGRSVRGALGELSRGGRTFDLVLADPPYADEPRALLEALEDARLLVENGVLVLEHARRAEVPDAVGRLALATRKRYGDTVLSFYRPVGTAPAAAASPGSRAAGPRGPRQSPLEHGPSAAYPGKSMDKIAVYPGSFDPITNGHLDVINRAKLLFDHVVIAIAPNISKAGLFTPEERASLIEQVVGRDPQLEVQVFAGLLVDYVRQRGGVIVRGLRAVADFEYEFQLALMNRRLVPSVDTVFLITDERSFYISSSLVREVAQFGGDVSDFVPPAVRQALEAKLRKK